MNTLFFYSSLTYLLNYQFLVNSYKFHFQQTSIVNRNPLKSSVQSLPSTNVKQPSQRLKVTTQISKKLISLLTYNNQNNIKMLPNDVDDYITELESNYIPVQTIKFLTFVLSGRWKLQYSNFFTPTLRNNVNISVDLFQDIQAYDSESTHVVLSENPIGNITNIISYNAFLDSSTQTNDSDGDESDDHGSDSSASLSDEIDPGTLTYDLFGEETSPVVELTSSIRKNYKGELHVQSNYTVNTKGEMFMELTGHLLLPMDNPSSGSDSNGSSNNKGKVEDDTSIPPDPGSFVLDLQRSVPLDLFDPSQLFLQHTFIDPNLRIVRIGSTQQGMTGIVHIFTQL